MTIRGPIIPILLWFIHHSTTCAETVTLRAKCPPIFSDHAIPPQPTPDKKIDWLSIQDRSGSWHRAQGTIDGEELIVSSPDVTDPIAVRYGFTNRPIGTTLYTQQGLPASPFTTESDWKILE